MTATKEAKELINVSINEIISLASYNIEENTVPRYYGQCNL